MAGEATCRRRGAAVGLGVDGGWSGQQPDAGGVAGERPQRRHGGGGRAARRGARRSPYTASWPCYLPPTHWTPSSRSTPPSRTPGPPQSFATIAADDRRRQVASPAVPFTSASPSVGRYRTAVCRRSQDQWPQCLPARFEISEKSA